MLSDRGLCAECCLIAVDIHDKLTAVHDPSRRAPAQPSQVYLQDLQRLLFVPTIPIMGADGISRQEIDVEDLTFETSYGVRVGLFAVTTVRGIPVCTSHISAALGRSRKTGSRGRA